MGQLVQRPDDNAAQDAWAYFERIVKITLAGLEDTVWDVYRVVPNEQWDTGLDSRPDGDGRRYVARETVRQRIAGMVRRRGITWDGTRWIYDALYHPRLGRPDTTRPARAGIAAA